MLTAGSSYIETIYGRYPHSASFNLDDCAHTAGRKIVTGLILPPTVNEFNYKPPYIKLGQNIGLLVGAAFWGVGADIWGRKYVLTRFSVTLSAASYLTGYHSTSLC